MEIDYGKEKIAEQTILSFPVRVELSGSLRAVSHHADRKKSELFAKLVCRLRPF